MSRSSRGEYLMSNRRLSVKRKLHWFLRICLGGVILGAGVGKALDVPGFVGVMRTYELGLPEATLWPLAAGVTLFELGLGSWILSGRRLRVAALLSAAMHLGYFVLLTSALWRGLDLQNCGCFGVFLARPLEWYTPLEDVVLIIASYGLFYLSEGRYQSEMSVAARGAAEVRSPGVQIES
jgi:uncharacterized membrane protein YphA (DoxX/SURF4 family)